MADNDTNQPDRADQPRPDLPPTDLTALQDFLLADESISPGSGVSVRPHELSVAQLESLLAQKRLEEARRNHRKLLTRAPQPASVAGPAELSATPRKPLVSPPALALPPTVPDKLSATRFEPASLVAARRPVARRRKTVGGNDQKKAVKGAGNGWLNWLGYTLETLVIGAALFLIGNWALQQAGISLNLFGSVGVADLMVGPSQPGGIVLKAQAGGTIELPVTPTPLPPTPTEAARTPGLTTALRPTPTLRPNAPLAVAPTPTPAIVPPVLQSLANGAAPLPKPPRRLIVPKLGLDSPVEEVTVNLGNWQVADNAVGHHLGTASPGLPGNMVLAGHRDIRGSVFLRLNELQRGDEFKVVSDNGVFQYAVTDVFEVAPTETSVMAPTIDPTATLITCTPVGLATKRLIIRARLER